MCHEIVEDVKTPDGEHIGYICKSCSQKYEIAIKKKD